jgi:ribosomal protein S27AE
MPVEDRDLKARMMAEAEKAIERLLVERSEKKELTLSDIERLVRAAGQGVMKEFTGELVEEEAQKAQSRMCPECGQKMRYKGKKGRDLATETGEVRLERAYYYCPTCRKGVFPPGPTVGDQ